MKQIVFILLFSAVMLLLLPSPDCYADDTEDYNVYAVYNGENYLAAYPNLTIRSSIVINNKPENLKVALVFVRDESNGLQSFLYFAYSESLADMNFTCDLYGNHNRYETERTIDTAKNLRYDYYHTSDVVTEPNLTLTGLDDNIYYVYYPQLFYEGLGYGSWPMHDYDFFEYDHFDTVYYYSGTDFNYSNIIASVLGGTEVEIDENGNVTNADYVCDLPTPINAMVRHTDSMDRWEFDVLWELPDFDTELDGRLYMEIQAQTFYEGRTGLLADWSQDVTDFHLITDDLSATALKFRYDIADDDEVLRRVYEFFPSLFSQMTSYNKAVVQKKFCDTTPFKYFRKTNYPTFMVRFYMVDSSGKKHVSNYVELKDSGDCEGYVANEVVNYDDSSSSFLPDKEIDNSSGLYDGVTDVMTNNTASDSDISSPTSLLRLIINDVKELPELVSRFFSFLPINFGYLLSLLLIVIMTVGIFRKIFGGD